MLFNLQDFFYVSKDIQILPIRLEKFASLLQHHNTWDFESLKNHLESDNQNADFSLIRIESPLALDILRCLAFLKADMCVSYELIKSMFIKRSDEDLDKALDYLRSNAEIGYSVEMGGYWVHETTQERLRVLLEPHKNELLERIVLALNNSIVRGEYDDDNIYINYLHATNVLSQEWASKATSANSADLYEKCSDIERNYLMFKSENYKRNLEFILEIRQNLLPARPLSVAASLRCLGSDECAAGNYNRGIVLYKQALDIYRALLPLDHLIISDLCWEMGEACNGKDAWFEEGTFEYWYLSLCICKVSFQRNHSSIEHKTASIESLISYLKKFQKVM